MSRKKAAKGLNLATQAIAEEKRKEKQKRIAITPPMLPSGRVPWMARRRA